MHVVNKHNRRMLSYSVQSDFYRYQALLAFSWVHGRTYVHGQPHPSLGQLTLPSMASDALSVHIVHIHTCNRHQSNSSWSYFSLLSP